MHLQKLDKLLEVHIFMTKKQPVGLPNIKQVGQSNGRPNGLESVKVQVRFLRPDTEDYLVLTYCISKRGQSFTQ